MSDNSKYPAFPTEPFELHSSYSGLTKREYFAGLAMQGICATSHPNAPTDGQGIAEVAVKFADALLAALEDSHGS